MMHLTVPSANNLNYPYYLRFAKCLRLISATK